MAYPALRTTKEDDNVVLSFLWRQLFTSDQAEALEREIFLLSSVRLALGTECLSMPQFAFTRKTQEGNVKCPFSTPEDTNSQRPTLRTSKHFPTIKVDISNELFSA